VALKDKSWWSVLPPLYLLVMPGMFCSGHLVLLTTPMLMFWCWALFYYERYQLTQDRHDLIRTALLLNAGTLIRQETAYLTLAILAHWAWEKKEKLWKGRANLLDAVMLAWFGLSLTPLWYQVCKVWSYHFGLDSLRHLTDIQQLISPANGYPYQIGWVGSIALGWGLAAIFIKRHRLHYSASLIAFSFWTIAITYVLYALYCILPNDRMLGVLPWGRQWETQNRFLISWCPFVALFMAEGIAQLPKGRWRAYLGAAVALGFLAQATVWDAPMTLPEFTSIRLRPDSEFPHLPVPEILDYVSRDVAL
jgi:hypothetical protein